MEINKHHIAPSQIIGIGPLMVNSSTDQTLANLYNARQLSFSLLLKNYSYEVKTDWLYLSGTDADQIQKSKATIEAFQAEYVVVKEEVVKLITKTYGNTDEYYLGEIARDIALIREIYRARR